ncbi:CBS domain-containing protein, partial [Candidatus Dependentiae bacterium]
SLISCANGKLCNLADLSIILPFQKEACEFNLAPTSSSTLCMAFGDAIAVCVSKLKGFNQNDFAKFHPAGALGKRLLLKVSSMMYPKTDLPLINPKANFKDLLLTISSKKLGIGIIVDQNKKLLGIVTDGDLRRACNLGSELFKKTAIEIASINPKSINSQTLAYDALKKMEKYNITSLVVTQQNNSVIGLIHIHDLVKAGIG